jgi:hypothetical protein
VARAEATEFEMVVVIESRGLRGIDSATIVLAQNGSSIVITKLVYAAVAAALLAPVPALAGGDIEPPGYYGGGPYEDYEDDEDYAPVVRKKVIVERPVVIRKKIVIERPVVVERPLIVERRVILEKRVFVERPFKHRKWRPRKHYRDGYRKGFHRKHYGDEEGDFHRRGYGPY